MIRYWSLAIMLGGLTAVGNTILRAAALDGGIDHPKTLVLTALLFLGFLSTDIPAYRLGAALAFLAVVVGVATAVPTHLWDTYAAAGWSLVIAAVLATTAWLTKPRCLQDRAVER